MSKKNKEKTESESIHDSLDAFIEYAENTRKYADVGAYTRISKYIRKVEADRDSAVQVLQDTA